MPLFIKKATSALFIHVPKTGGTSVEKWLVANGWSRRDYDSSNATEVTSSNYYRRCPPQHWEGQMLERIYALEKIPIKFLLVRNPFDRLLSEYRWRHPNSLLLPLKLRTTHFVQWWNNVRSAFERNPRVFENHIRPQVDFLVEGATVGKFETDLSNEFLQGLFLKQGEKRWDSPLGNSNSSKEFRLDVPRATLSEIADFYAEDFSAFSYQVPTR